MLYKGNKPVPLKKLNFLNMNKVHLILILTFDLYKPGLEAGAACLLLFSTLGTEM